MRTALSALVLSLLVWSCASAQSRGASDSSTGASKGSASAITSRSFSATPAVTNSGASSTSASSSTVVVPTPGRKFFFGSLGNSRNHFRDRDFGRDFRRDHRNRFPFGGYPFGYGYGYGYDYSSWYADQNQAQNQEYMAQSERLEQSYQDDVKRQRELDRQLADQRAADATEANTRYAPSATAPAQTPTERELPPTVLVYKDHHQTEVHNYAITSTMIYEFNPHWTRKIALADLDIPATIAANNERGIEFNVPGSSPAKAKQ